MKALAPEARETPYSIGWWARIRQWPKVAALGFGALTALALPPLHIWPLLLGFAGLLHLLRYTTRSGRAFWLGWWFGFGHFLVGLYWIAIAFTVDPERFGALAVPALALLCAFLALYSGFAAWAVTRCRLWLSPTAAALAFALAWTAGEILRGAVLWGFPWNLIGYSWANSSAISQLAAVTGIHGLSFLSVALGALPAGLLEPRGRARWRPVLAGLAVLGLVWLGGSLRLSGAAVEFVPEVRLRLVQGNVAQHHKWQPELRARWFERHLELTRPKADVTHVIWPESATPYPIEQEAEVRRLIGQVVPQAGLLLTGGNRFDPTMEPIGAWNSLFVLDQNGMVRARYDKRDLVPFGEFLPFRPLLARIGLGKLTAGTVDFLPGPNRTTIDLQGLPPFSPLICYEVIFPGRVLDPNARPDWLLNITNDAWFGRSSGPYQHLAMARMRTVEEGVPLIRSANSGISASIDPWGRVIAELGLGETGVLDLQLAMPLPPTLYARFGAWIIVFMASGCALTIVLIEFRRKKAT